MPNHLYFHLLNEHLLTPFMSSTLLDPGSNEIKSTEA